MKELGVPIGSYRGLKVGLPMLQGRKTMLDSVEKGDGSCSKPSHAITMLKTCDALHATILGCSHMIQLTI